MPATVFPAPGTVGSVAWNTYTTTATASSSGTTVTLSGKLTDSRFEGLTPSVTSGTGSFASNTVINSAPFMNTYAASFNGTNQYLTVPSTGTNAAFTFAGNFTVEGWYYPTSTTGDHAIFCLGTETTNRYVWYISSGGQISSNLFGGTTKNYTVTTIPINTWTHIAIVRTTSTVTVYVNGVASVTTDTQAGTIGNGVVKVGSDSGGTANFAGYISNFRVASVAVYTTAFNPSATTLTATQSANVNGNPSVALTGTQTSVLTCQSATIIDNGVANVGVGFTIANSGTVTTGVTTVPGNTFIVNIAPTVALSGASISIANGSLNVLADVVSITDGLLTKQLFTLRSTSNADQVSRADGLLTKQLFTLRDTSKTNYVNNSLVKGGGAGAASGISIREFRANVAQPTLTDTVTTTDGLLSKQLFTLRDSTVIVRKPDRAESNTGGNATANSSIVTTLYPTNLPPANIAQTYFYSILAPGDRYNLSVEQGKLAASPTASDTVSSTDGKIRNISTLRSPGIDRYVTIGGRLKSIASPKAITTNLPVAKETALYWQEDLIAYLIGSGDAQNQATFTTLGAQTWTVPENVSSISIVLVGGGGGGGPSYGGGGGGGALTYLNSLSVIPGTTYNLFVGAGGVNGGAGQASWFNTAAYLFANGGATSTTGANQTGGGGGGAGGYAGVGGAGGSGATNNYPGGAGGTGGGTAAGLVAFAGGAGGNGSSTNQAAGAAGVATGGSGAGGSGAFIAPLGGGGVGYLGQSSVNANGASTTAGTATAVGGTGVTATNGGSGGTDGSSFSGGLYGGGGSGYIGSVGGQGMVRIIWSTGRTYPTTKTTDQAALDYQTGNINTSSNNFVLYNTAGVNKSYIGRTVTVTSGTGSYPANTVITGVASGNVVYTSNAPSVTLSSAVLTVSTTRTSTTRAPTNARENLFYLRMAPGKRYNLSTQQGVRPTPDPNRLTVPNIASNVLQSTVTYTNRPGNARENLNTAILAPGLRYSLSTEQGYRPTSPTVTDVVSRSDGLFTDVYLQNGFFIYAAQSGNVLGLQGAATGFPYQFGGSTIGTTYTQPFGGILKPGKTLYGPGGATATIVNQRFNAPAVYDVTITLGSYSYTTTTLTLSSVTGMYQGSPIRFSAAVTGTNLVANTTYYVTSISGTTVTLTTVSPGNANITVAAGSGSNSSATTLVYYGTISQGQPEGYAQDATTTVYATYIVNTSQTVTAGIWFVPSDANFSNRPTNSRDSLNTFLMAPGLRYSKAVQEGDSDFHNNLTSASDARGVLTNPALAAYQATDTQFWTSSTYNTLPTAYRTKGLLSLGDITADIPLRIENGKITATYVSTATTVTFAANISSGTLTLYDTSAASAATNNSFLWNGSDGGFRTSGIGTNTTFCLEMWIYPTVAGTSLWSSGNGGTQFNHYVTTNADGSITWFYGAGFWIITGSDTIASAGSVTTNAWNHVAFIGNGSTVTCMVNGVYKGVSSNVRTLGSFFYIGSYFNNYNNDGSFFRGYMKDVRYVSGSQVYSTGGFSTPYIPLVSISGTTLLTLQSDPTGLSSYGTTPTVSIQSPFDSDTFGYSVPITIPDGTVISGSTLSGTTTITDQTSPNTYDVSPIQTNTTIATMTYVSTSGVIVNYTNRPQTPRDTLSTFQMAPGLRYNLSVEQGKIVADTSFKKKPPVQFWN